MSLFALSAAVRVWFWIVFMVLMLERNESFTYLEYLFAPDLAKTDEQLEVENKFGICVQVTLCLNLVVY